MADSTFVERLALLPKLDATQRTFSHINAQKTYTKFYASEGRAYISSWQDECPSDLAQAQSGNNGNILADKVAGITFDTPILKPRSRKPDPPKSVISIASSGSENLKKVTKPIISGKYKGEKSEQKTKKRSKLTQPKKKKRVNQSPSDSSKAERLKERRVRKRAKRAILSSPPASDQENEKDGKPSARKKGKDMLPAGFALMHGFSATNVGKNRLTMKPLVSIGFFNKGKASVKTKASASRKKDHAAGYFSESKFLNKAPEIPSKLETSSDRNPTSSSSVAVNEPPREDAGAKDLRISSGSPELSIVWDIELGKPLSHDNVSVLVAPAEKPGNIILDVTRQTWAKQFAKDSGQKTPSSIVPDPPPSTADSKGENEGTASIGPSQSASQVITNAGSRPNMTLREERSKYFQDVSKGHESQTQVRAQSPAPCTPRICPHVVAQEGSMVHISAAAREGPTEDAVLFQDFLIPTETPEIVPRYLHQEFQSDDQTDQNLADMSPFEDVDREQEFYLCAEYTDHRLCTAYGEIEDFETFQEYGLDEIPLPHGYLEGFIPEEENDMIRDHDSEAENAPFEKFDSFGDSDEGNLYLDYSERAADSEMDEFYGYYGGHGESYGNATDLLVGVEPSENGDEVISESSENEVVEQGHRFYQGRALLLGCPMQEAGDPTKAAPRYPRLSSLEADVAKSLRDHWHPRRL